MRKKQKPKFKVGQVVNVYDFIDPRMPGETGPGFRMKPGWRWGWAFGKIVKVLFNEHAKPKYRYSYFLAEWPSALPETNLRKLSSPERGNQ